MSWVDAIVSNLRALLEFLLPFRVLRPYQRGVVFRFGHYHRTAEDGFRWMWPFRIEEMEVIGVAEETRNLLSQTVTTKDDVPVTFSCNIVFRTVDAAKYLINVHDCEASLDALAMTHLAARVRDWTYEELLGGQRELERSLKGTLTTRVDKWGTEIVSVGFTDLVRAKPFRLFGDPAPPSFKLTA